MKRETRKNLSRVLVEFILVAAFVFGLGLTARYSIITPSIYVAGIYGWYVVASWWIQFVLIISGLTLVVRVLYNWSKGRVWNY